MMDQAQHLRELIRNSKQAKKVTRPKSDARFICVSSGKGGVGKSNITLNLSIKLASMGKKVLIVDADLGLSNIEVLLGIMPSYNLSHILNNLVSVEDIIMSAYGVDIISGGSGVLDVTNLSDESLQNLIHAFQSLNEMYDYIFIDTGAGIDRSVMSFISASQEVIIVVSPDPTSITDAYALIKNARFDDKQVFIVINMSENVAEGKNVYNKLEVACKNFLGLKVDNLGVIPHDFNVVRAVRSQVPFITEFSFSIAAKSVSNIANNLEYGDNKIQSENRFTNFMNKLFKW